MCSVLRSVRTAGRRWRSLRAAPPLISRSFTAFWSHPAFRYSFSIRRRRQILSLQANLFRCDGTGRYCLSLSLYFRNLFSGDGFGRCHDHAAFPFMCLTAILSLSRLFGCADLFFLTAALTANMTAMFRTSAMMPVFISLTICGRNGKRVPTVDSVSVMKATVPTPAVMPAKAPWLVMKRRFGRLNKRAGKSWVTRL